MCSMIFLASPGLSSSESDNEDGSGPQSKVPRLLSTRRKWSGTPGSGVASRRPAVKITPRPATQNIVHKLWNREQFGAFNSRQNGKSDELPFLKIPERLRFCLRDIVPYCYLDDHVFMGLTSCGQFLLSYTVAFEEEDEELTQNYSFNNGYKYKLFFWIYRPNTMLTNFYQVCLFDDHGVDIKTVSMVQWASNPRLLLVHGASDCENEECYLSYVAVPKLGCRECNEIRKSESDENCQTDTLCIRCNLTIHSKYTRTDSDPQLVSHVNCNHPDYLVTVSNGFIHSLHINLEKPPQMQQQQQQRLMPKPNYSSYVYQQLMRPFYSSPAASTMDEIELTFGEANVTGRQKPTTIAAGGNNEASTSGVLLPGLLHSSEEKTEDATTMVANIIADFAECETKANNISVAAATGRTPEKGRMFFSSPVSQQMRWRGSGGTNNNNNINTVPGPKVADSYEFSEETEERCEKISLFRKKRLADKRYEFSEDNSENIIPFNRMRTRSTSLLSGNASVAAIGLSSSSPGAVTQTIGIGGVNNAGSAASGSGMNNYFDLTSHHAHRGSPSYGFRSPCGSPIGNRCLRSPSGGGYPPTLSSSPSSPAAGGASGMFSPKHQYHFKRFNSLPPYVFSSPKRCGGDQLQEILPGNHQHGYNYNFSSNINNNNGPLLMPPPPQLAVAENSQGGGGLASAAATTAVAEDEKLVFSKKVVRRFVEETDAASVITNEEDDCISPGYHTSLPMEVHGSCYSVMHMISAASASKLTCPVVKVTQISFDMDQFTYYVANHVCEKQEKRYGVFYDWACELVSICKYSGIATCVLAVHFTATDRLPVVVVGQRGGVGRSVSSRQQTSPTVQLSSSKGGDIGDAGNYDCINCSSNLDCVFHRKHYQCCSLFTWDVATGDWTVLDYGELVEMGPRWRSQSTKKQTTILRARARKMANQLRGGCGDEQEGEGKKRKENKKGERGLGREGVKEELVEDHLRVLDSCNAKSKDALTDLRNCIEFYRGSVDPAGFHDLSDVYENNSSEEDEDGDGEDEEADE